MENVGDVLGADSNEFQISLWQKKYKIQTKTKIKNLSCNNDVQWSLYLCICFGRSDDMYFGICDFYNQIN